MRAFDSNYYETDRKFGFPQVSDCDSHQLVFRITNVIILHLCSLSAVRPVVRCYAAPAAKYVEIFQSDFPTAESYPVELLGISVLASVAPRANFEPSCVSSPLPRAPSTLFVPVHRWPAYRFRKVAIRFCKYDTSVKLVTAIVSVKNVEDI